MVKRQAAGFSLPVGHDDTARDVELALEGRFTDHGLVRSAHQREIVAEDPLTCVARGGGQALEIMDKYNIDLLSSE